MPEPMLMVAGGAVLKTLELVKALEPLIDKFSALPKSEALHLAAALDEVHKQLQSVFECTEQYRRLAIVRDFENVAPAVLSALEGPKARIAVEHNGGSCQVIATLYDQHLNSWFRSTIGKVWKQDDYRQAEDIFRILTDADQGLFSDMAQVCEFLGREAKYTKDCVLKGDWDGARVRVEQGQAALQTMEAELAQTMSALLKVRNSAIKRAGITSLRSAPPSPA